MDKLIIKGGKKLSGEVTISSAKNATLPILAATLLVDGKTHFKNLPELQDVHFTFKLLENLGAKIQEGSTTVIDTSNIDNLEAPYDLVRKMRASILVLGPLLARFGKARVSLPGGCAIGTRPIDLHLSGLAQMGAKIDLEQGYVNASCDKLVGCKIDLRFPSVGATENLIMAAALAEGKTVINNAAAEPEISDLCNFLSQRGVEISGAGTSSIKIIGVDKLKDNTSEYEIISDRIVSLTYLIAALMTKSEVLIKNTRAEDFQSVIELLMNAGANFEITENSNKGFKS